MMRRCDAIADGVPAPQAALAASVFDHAELDFNPMGHAPTNGKDDGYGVPHFDVHFFLKPWSAEACKDIRLGAAFDAAGAANSSLAARVARSAAASTAAFLAEPPPALLPADGALVLDPESIVPTQGVH